MGRSLILHFNNSNIIYILYIIIYSKMLSQKKSSYFLWIFLFSLDLFLFCSDRRCLILKPLELPFNLSHIGFFSVIFLIFLQVIMQCTADMFGYEKSTLLQANAVAARLGVGMNLRGRLDQLLLIASLQQCLKS